MIVRLTKRQHASMQFWEGALAAKEALVRSLVLARDNGRGAATMVYERDLRQMNKFIAKLGNESESSKLAIGVILC
jgi:hypothetical protein